MPTKTFRDSQNKEHVIVLQEKSHSCAMACVASIIRMFKNEQVNEAEIRLRSQRFFGGYRPHPMDIHSNTYPLRRTFISQLVQ